MPLCAFHLSISSEPASSLSRHAAAGRTPTLLLCECFCRFENVSESSLNTRCESFGALPEALVNTKDSLETLLGCMLKSAPEGALGIFKALLSNAVHMLRTLCECLKTLPSLLFGLCAHAGCVAAGGSRV